MARLVYVTEYFKDFGCKDPTAQNTLSLSSLYRTNVLFTPLFALRNGLCKELKQSVYMTSSDSPSQPSLPWRIGPSIIMGVAGSLSRVALFATNTTEVHGLDGFVELLDRRRDVEKRDRGLLTVSNHTSIVDDPLTWGALPFSYSFNPSNHRWTLGSHDICFSNKILSTIFSLGQVLPTHRHIHSIHGGLFQSTMTQAVRLLSRPPFNQPDELASHPPTSSARVNPSIRSPDITDPFSEPHLTYSTNGLDTFPAPSAYPSRQYSWLHIFPEGFVHQHPHRTMRYFKWGVARLILEPDVCPDIVPIWIEGNEQIMHEARSWPRWIPRLGKKLGIWFGDNVGGDNSVFTELRTKWRELVKEDRGRRSEEDGKTGELGILSEELKYGKEAIELRMECARKVRGELLKLRRRRGLPDEDPKEGLVETWRREGGRRDGEMQDGSWVKDI